MSRPDPFTGSSYPARAKAAGFVFRNDEFSVQARHVTQPMFWLRIDRDETRWVRITDLAPAHMPPQDVALAVAAALDMLDHPNRDNLYLVDIDPHASGSPDPARVADLRATVAAYAKLHRQFVLSWQAETQAQKPGVRAIIGV